MDWCGRYVGLTVFLLLLVGTGLRLGYQGMVERSERDESFYITKAEKWEDLSEDDPTRYPLLVHVGLLIDRLGFDVESGLRCFNLCCSGLWLYMMYQLGKAVFSSKNIGLICLALAVFNPYTIRIGAAVLREPLYLLVFSCGLFCATQIVRGVGILRYAALLGLLTILGLWSRAEGAEMQILMPLAVVFRAIAMWDAKIKRPGGKLRLAGGILLYLLTLGAAGVALYSFCPRYFSVLRWWITFGLFSR